MSANGSQSESSSESSQNVWGPQGRHLRQLYGQASRFADPSGAQNMAQSLLGQINPMFDGALGTLGGLMDAQGQIDAQGASLQAGLGDLFRNELMPAIDSNSIAGGGFGGGRQGVAQSNAVGEISNAYTQGMGDITARANAQAGNAAGMIPGFAQGMFDMNMQGQNAGMNVLGLLSSILGSPTVLSKSSSNSESGSFGFGLI